MGRPIWAAFATRWENMIWLPEVMRIWVSMQAMSAWGERGTPPHWNPSRQVRHSMTQFDTVRWEWNGVLCDTSNVLSYLLIFVSTFPVQLLDYNFLYPLRIATLASAQTANRIRGHFLWSKSTDSPLRGVCDHTWSNNSRTHIISWESERRVLILGGGERGGWGWHDKQFHHLTPRCYHRIRNFSTF